MTTPNITPSSTSTSTPSPPPSLKNSAAAAASSGVETVLRTLFGSCTGVGTNSTIPILNSVNNAFPTSSLRFEKKNDRCRKGRRGGYPFSSDDDRCGKGRGTLILEEDDQDMTIRRLRYASDKRKFKAVSSAHSR
eukprot:CAMPEP_0172507622 /NCGR_PEP_ID=MMETSP1066-20121228/205161_1 /TAXON_ID=671091 /ORGANISM="Coscinodiscus wailesii, Strain CCMP2513" /LENGTH=134 /DNA_ID=CAMNT_0013285235 /DNA_START=23 /DNA_END=423 /DNA_ORIENTATION=+